MFCTSFNLVVWKLAMSFNHYRAQVVRTVIDSSTERNEQQLKLVDDMLSSVQLLKQTIELRKSELEQG